MKHPDKLIDGQPSVWLFTVNFQQKVFTAISFIFRSFSFIVLEFFKTNFTAQKCQELTIVLINFFFCQIFHFVLIKVFFDVRFF